MNWAAAVAIKAMAAANNNIILNMIIGFGFS